MGKTLRRHVVASEKTGRVLRRLRVLLLLSAFGAVACGSGTPQPTVAAADNEASELVFLIKSGSTEGGPIQARLRQIGYQVVADPSTPHSAEVVVTAHNMRNSSFFKVTVNGEQQVSYTTYVTVQLIADGVTLASSSVHFDKEDGIGVDDVENLVAAITNNGTLLRLARESRERKSLAELAAARSAREEAERKSAQEDAARQQAEQEDDAAWAQVVLAECTSPRNENGCDPVKAYLAKFPTGRHASNARTTLEAGTAAIVVVADERDWNDAEVAVCGKPKTSADCDGVKRYIAAHPTGAHVSEARSTLDPVREQLEKLAQKEQREVEREAQKEARRAEAEAKRAEAEEKKAQLEGCKDQCKDACVDWRTGGVRAPCFNHCVARDCN